MDRSADCVEKLFALKHRLVHFIQTIEKNDQQNEISNVHLDEAKQTIIILRQRIDELECENHTLALRFQHGGALSTHDDEQNDQNDHNENPNSLQNRKTLSLTSDYSTTSLSNISLVVNTTHKHTNNNNNNNNNGTKFEYENLKQQFESLKVAYSDHKSALSSIQVENEKLKRECELLSVKNQHISVKLSKLESKSDQNCDDLNTTIQDRLNTFNTLNNDFYHFLSTYQGNVMYNTKHMGLLHVNIDQLNRIIGDKITTLTQLQSDIFRLRRDLSKKDGLVHELSGVNKVLEGKCEHLNRQHRHNLGLLQSQLLLGLQQQTQFGNNVNSSHNYSNHGQNDANNHSNNNNLNNEWQNNNNIDINTHNNNTTPIKIERDHQSSSFPISRSQQQSQQFQQQNNQNCPQNDNNAASNSSPMQPHPNHHQNSQQQPLKKPYERLPDELSGNSSTLVMGEVNSILPPLESAAELPHDNRAGNVGNIIGSDMDTIDASNVMNDSHDEND
jgi:hypothetical protein